MAVTTITNVVEDAEIKTQWGNDVADTINNHTTYLPIPTAIIEKATTPAGTVTDELRWSSIHKAMMVWTGTQWKFAGGPPSYFTAATDFSHTATSGNNFGSVAAINSGGQATLTSPTQDAGHPGILSMSSSISASSGGYLASTADGLAGGNTGLRFRCVFRLPASAFVAGGIHHIGFHDASSTSAAAVDGIYLEILNGTGTFKSASNSSITSNATTVTIAADTWYTLHIWFVTSTTARCVLVKDDGTIALDVTNAANVPDVTRIFCTAYHVLNTGTTALVMALVDWIGMGFATV